MFSSQSPKLNLIPTTEAHVNHVLFIAIKYMFMHNLRLHASINMLIGETTPPYLLPDQ